MAPATSLILLLMLHLPYDSVQPVPHIRVLDHGLSETFELALTQSPTFRELVGRVDAASVLVFADCGGRMPARIGARLRLVTSIKGVRYVRVDVDCSLSPRRQVALLAHEIQHAIEIGDRPDIVDEDAMESFYEDFGFLSFENGTHRNFETDAALDVQQAVDEEIGRKPRLHGGTAY